MSSRRPAPGQADPAPTGPAGSAPPGRSAASGRRSAAPGEQQTPDGIPRLLRRTEQSVVGGIAAGISGHLRVPVLAVRVAFVLMALMAGAGVVAYALLWIFVPAGPAGPAGSFGGAAGMTGGAPGATASEPGVTERAERRQAIGLAAVGLAVLIVATALGVNRAISWVLGPLGLAALGGGFIWREADDARRASWRRTAAGFVGPSRGSGWRLGGGIALVVGGLSIFAVRHLDFVAYRSVLIGASLTLVGVAVITVPWWLHLMRDLGSERQGRILERERAEVAAHLHDSVLQTLTLIQRQAGDSREVLRLARGQERELRAWLYGPAGYTAPGDPPQQPGLTFAAALAAAAGEVEDTYALAVTPVLVGDTGMDPHLSALVAAAREAMINAAKHSGAAEVSVYAEIEPDAAAVFVRDRGSGFDLGAVGADRRGLAESIRGRIQRHGGSVMLRSTPGEGTEVELHMPIESRSQAPGSQAPGTPVQGAPADSGAPA